MPEDATLCFRTAPLFAVGCPTGLQTPDKRRARFDFSPSARSSRRQRSARCKRRRLSDVFGINFGPCGDSLKAQATQQNTVKDVDLDDPGTTAPTVIGLPEADHSFMSNSGPELLDNELVAVESPNVACFRVDSLSSPISCEPERRLWSNSDMERMEETEMLEESVMLYRPDALECKRHVCGDGNPQCAPSYVAPRLKISRLGNRLLEVDLYAWDPDVPLMKYLVDPSWPLQSSFVTPPSLAITLNEGARLKAIEVSCENARQSLQEKDFERAKRYAQKAVKLFLNTPWHSSGIRDNTTWSQAESTVQIEELPDDEAVETATNVGPAPSEKLPVEMVVSAKELPEADATDHGFDDDDMDIVQEFSRLSLKRTAEDDTSTRCVRQKNR